MVVASASKQQSLLGNNGRFCFATKFNWNLLSSQLVELGQLNGPLSRAITVFNILGRKNYLYTQLEVSMIRNIREFLTLLVF